MIKFFVKDEETFENRFLYPVFLYSNEGKIFDWNIYLDPKLDSFFQGVKPWNLYQDSNSLDIINKYLKLLTTYNIIWKAILRKRN